MPSWTSRRTGATATWSATSLPRSSRAWADGWDREATCPPDIRGYLAAREVGAAAGERWRTAHGRRILAVRLLRQAGYVQRWRWARRPAPPHRRGGHILPSWVYTDGPAVGCEAVDAWHLARVLRMCAAAWYVQLRLPADGQVYPLGAPRACGRYHLCPMCAPRRSARLAHAMRAVIGAGVLDAGRCVMLTLTHRDAIGETLVQAIARHRDAWLRMTRGRPGRRWRETIEGWYVGLETTRNSEAKTWHVHAHVVAVLAPGRTDADAEGMLLHAWQAATSTAAAAAGLPGYGWDPVSGYHIGHTRSRVHPRECARCRETLPPGSTAGTCRRWIQPIRTEAELYQASKYPTPLVELAPAALAEFLSASYGRRWHEGGGTLRSVLRDADRMEEAAGTDPRGLLLTDPRWRRAPDLDDAAPDLGTPTDTGRAPRVDVLTFHPHPHLPAEAVEDALRDIAPMSEHGTMDASARDIAAGLRRRQGAAAATSPQVDNGPDSG